MDFTPRKLFRSQQTGLLAVILLMGLLLTFAAAPLTVRGQTVNNFFRLDNLIPKVATPMSWMAIMAIGGWIFLSQMVAGREVYAVGGNEEAARFSGLPVGAIKLRVYALSGLCAGIAGMVSTGYFGSANTATGEGYELIVIAAAVVGGASLTGGRGSALGAVLGALIIKLIENGIYILKAINLGIVTLTLSKEYSKIIIGCAIVIAVAIDRLSDRIHKR